MTFIKSGMTIGCGGKMAGRQKRSNIHQPETEKKSIPIDIEDLCKSNSEKIQTLVQDLSMRQAEIEAHLEELKRIQLELQLSRDKYQELYNAIPVGYLTTDKSYAILEANATTTKLLGIPRSLLLKSKFTDFMSHTQQSQDIFHSHIRKICTTGYEEMCELEMQRNDGSRFYAHLQTVGAGNAPDQISQFHLTVTDITERKKTEEALKGSEEKYRYLFETMAQGVIYQDITGRIISANAAAERILGLTLEQFRERGADNPHGKAIHEDGSEFSNEQHPSAIALKTGQAVKDIIMGFFNPKERAYRWTNVCAIPQFKSGEVLPFQIYVTLFDITELKRIKDELEIRIKERTSELEHSEEKYRLLVENANEAIMVFQDNRLKFFNNKAVEISGYSPKELASKPINEFVHADDSGMVMERYLKLIQGEKVSTSDMFRIIRKDGEIRWVEINGVLITWEGKPALLGLLNDVSDRKIMEQELKAYAQRITQVQEEERKRIAYELHDDTAQYLSILKLQLDALIQSGKIQDPQIIKKLQYLEIDAGRAVNDIRRYSHELRPGVLDHLGLRAALEQIAEDLNKLNHFTVELEVEGKEQELSEAVKLGFFRIAQEALNNARKHAKASNAIIKLDFQENKVRLIVSDNGTGFDVREAAAQSIQRGSLGLMSMQERAKLIGAELRIDSKPGEGTSVVVEMPLKG